MSCGLVNCSNSSYARKQTSSYLCLLTPSFEAISSVDISKAASSGKLLLLIFLLAKLLPAAILQFLFSN